MAQRSVSALRREHILQLASEGYRTDGRKLEQTRTFEYKVGYITTAEGSCEVMLGQTRVIAGVKMTPGDPYPDGPGQGVMITTAELRPIASPSFEHGPPSEEAIEVARVVDRGIRDSGAIDFADLCIEHGKKVWVSFLDMHFLDHDGNLFDAGGLAALLALKNTVIPGAAIGGPDKPLPFARSPVPVTFVKVGDFILVDPSREEEDCADLRLTITTTCDGKVCAIQKGLKGTLTQSEVSDCVLMAQSIGDQIRETIGKM